MGMFDYVNYECVCPVCKNKADGFQTKDKDCMLVTLNPRDVDNFYTHCGTCGVLIEFNREDKVNFQRIICGKNHKRLIEYNKLIAIK